MISHALGVVLAVTTLGCAAHLGGAAKGVARPTTVIRITSFTFAPAEITVSTRDSIVWLNDDGFAHTSTSDTGVWASPELSKGGRYVLVAPAPGRYTYHCAAHPGMKGVLEVRLEE